MPRRRPLPYWAGSVGDPSLIDDLAAPVGFYPHPMMQQGIPFHGMAPPGMFPGNRAASGYQAAAFGGQQQVPYRRIMPTVPGAPALGFRDQSVGLGSVQFDATSGVALTLEGSPGRPFKGRRLMFDVTRDGTTSTGLLTITQFFVGDVNQLVGRSSLLVAAFAPTSFGADGQYSACAPALTISVQVTLGTPALTMTDTVTVGGQFNGETIGG